jgi:D-aminopeptidase
MADSAQVMPGVKRVEPLVVNYTSGDILEIYRAFITLIGLAGMANQR